jgi:tRNA-binding EMAP/Myf-like protein
LRFEIDFGEEKPRQILAGLAEYYEPETLIGRKVVVVANLKPRKMRGLESQGMICAASLEDGTGEKPALSGIYRKCGYWREIEIMIFVDSHCHIDGEAFDADRDEVVERAKAAGVAAMLTIGTGNPHNGEIERAVKIAEKYENVFAAVGVHPHDAKLFDDERRKII